MKEFRFYDADRHVIEPIQMWIDYVDEEIYKEFPINILFDTDDKRVDRVYRLGEKADVTLPPIYKIGNHDTLRHWDESLQLACLDGHNNQSERIKAIQPDTQIESMDESGVDWASIQPTFASFIVNNELLPSRVSLAYAQAYNSWLKDYCSYCPDRLFPIALISRHDTGNMLFQLNQVIVNGWKAIVVRPEMILGKTLGHSDYNEFWKRCEENNIAVSLHGGTHAQLQTAGSDRFTDHFSLHACSHPIELQMAFLSLLQSGVLERHPKLKFAFLEAGASWVPHWLWRLDNICYPEFKSLTCENIKMLPSEYFKRQCWVGFELGEPCLRDVINIIGHEKLIYGSDFPHPDHSQFSIEDVQLQLPELTKSELVDLLENNAKVFYGFENHKNESALSKETNCLVGVD